ncbi:conserved hypothetical protein [Leishmania major strain Friedlin]|uniref:GRIP domain-containing protein n=1 Tax=Leishmania major TaxID=5664 RepID=Q4Q3R9_LEIMA|nr:conserved hypothetical protein [Leishmania major strain Friedlin]CAG9580922.1 hypothetical_protein_-_conserved [Leishmania major strain Friedlin]CAJ06739.1 conserved hypothetical protein [Leishmania major strain Friedlin]|eukprot:XP_001686029.1 conserved hypothetical protein [Leishmania major strain Friedlin]
MLREWTSKIKSFAEGIASPDYDDEGHSGSGECEDDEVDGRVEHSHYRPHDERGHARHRGSVGVTRATAHGQHNSGAVYGDAGSAAVLEDPTRRLALQYNDLTGDRHAGACASVDAAAYARASSVSAVAAPSFLSLSPSPPSTAASEKNLPGNVGPLMASPQAVAATQCNGAEQTPAESPGDDTVAAHSFSSSPGGAQTASASAAERRGPPQARMTSSPQPDTSQPLPAQLSAPLSSPSAAPISCISPAKSAGAVLPAPVATAAPPTPPTQQPHLPEQAHMLGQRVALLEAEKAHLRSDICKYQDEVRARHEQAVQYYEVKLREAAGTAADTASAREANAQQQPDALRAALQVAADQLEGEKALKTALEGRVGELQQEADELRASLAAAQKEVATTTATATAASAPSGTPDATSVPAEEDWCRDHSEELNSLKNAVDVKTTQLAAQAAQLQSSEALRRSLEAKLQAAQREAMADVTDDHGKRADAARDEQHSHAQLQNEVNRLKCELEAERRRSATTQALFEDAQRKNEDLAAQLAHEQAISKSVAATLEQTRKSASASAATAAATAAASAAHGEERQRLAEKLDHVEAERGVLQQEVRQLTEAAGQLQRTLDTREHEYAVAQAEWAEAQKALLEKRSAFEAQMAKDRDAYQEELRRLQAQLEGEQKRGKALEADKQAAERACTAAEAHAVSAEQRCGVMQEELAALQQQLKRLKEAEQNRQQQERQRMTESEAKESGVSMSAAVLTQVKKELEGKVQALEVMMEQLQRMTVDTLVRLGVDVERVVEGSRRHGGGAEREPSGGDDGEEDDKEGERGWAAAGTEVPLLQLFSLLMTESLQQHSIVLRAERVQQEWEQTYEQARRVNDSLNQQMADAWGVIGKLREELSLKDEAARQMKSHVDSGDARLVEVQEQLTGVMHELQTLREERAGWAVRLQQAETDAESQANTVSSLQEELNTLQDMLQAKEEELQTSLQGNENLQLVLDRIQENKRHEVEALTLESQLEAEELKKQLAEARRIREQHESEVACVREGFERQIASKDAEVTTMHRKLAEMRKALEKTTRRHMDGSETSIDKRVVSQLLAKYMHAFVAQRKEAEDMLKVLSGLLDWDEATQEYVGLLPGPNNPQPPDGSAAQRGGARRGLFKWLRSGGEEANKAGLASKWVEFLLKESEGSGGDGRANRSDVGATASVPASSTSTPLPGSQPVPSLSFPSPSPAAETATPETAASRQST